MIAFAAYSLINNIPVALLYVPLVLGYMIQASTTPLEDSSLRCSSTGRVRFLPNVTTEADFRKLLPISWRLLIRSKFPTFT